ncbi:MAG: DUF11 domain-containing protein [Trueperaceae bacterium]|nr:DUF11 domain-containing protein [Trueperaceae bacterium]
MASFALAVGTPAGEEITNQATARYTDSGGQNQTTNSNQVITVVKQIYGVSIVADGTTTVPGQSQNATPGATVYYPYTLTNTGNGIDSFDLASTIDTDDTSDNGSISTPVFYLDSDGDGVVDAGESQITSVADLAADASVKIIMAYRLPTGADSNDEVIATITGTSANDPAGTPASDSNNYHKTTVVQDATIVISKSVSVSEAEPGDTLTYTITATNTGSRNATTVTLTDAAPTGTTIVSASVSTIPSGNAADTSIPVAIFATVIPGQTVQMSFSVTVDAGTLPGDIDNSASVSFVNSASSTISAMTNTTTTTVLPSYDVAVGPKDDPLDGSAGDSASAISYTNAEGYTVTAADDDDEQTVAEADAGDTVSFTNSVKNMGTASDTFNITLDLSGLNLSAGYSVVLTRLDGTPLPDTDGDGTPDSGPLARTAEFDFIVKVFLPSNQDDSDGATTVHSVVVTATSSNDDAQSDTTTDTITDVKGPGVDFGNNTDTDVDGADDDAVDSALAVTRTQNPGTKAVFPMDVVNTGSRLDSYDLSGSVSFTSTSGATLSVNVVYYPASADTSGDGTLSNAEITAATPITNTGLINPDTDAEITVFAVVAIPATATPQTATVSQSASSPLTGVSKGFNLDQITVNAVRDFTFNPDRNGTVPSPGTIIYQHSITNNGNLNITDIDISESASGNTTGWTYLYSYNGTTYYPAASLPAPTAITPGSSQTVFVKVNAPAGVPRNANNILTVTAAPTFGSEGSSSGSDTVTDTTTVISGELTVVKEWSADGGTNWFKGDGTDGSTPPEVAPGGDILYRMRITNIGTANVTATSLLDSVPTFTDYVTGSARFQTTQGGSDTIFCSNDGGSTFTVTCPAAAGSSPFNVDTAIDAVRFYIASIAPGSTVEVRFTVRIQ